MKRLGLSLLASALGPVALPAGEPAPAAWTATRWHDEAAFASTSHGWKAVVSFERGRLVYFGPADRDANLLFASATRADPAGWGGHRQWLGPQSAWPQIWPPPAAWESRPPESATQESGRLRLALADAGEGWPRVARTYEWSGPRLQCGVELTGGTKAAQVIQIIQVPPGTVIEAQAVPAADSPAGYVLLPSGATPRLTADFPPPNTHVTREGDVLQLHYRGIILKLGFRPQPLRGRSDAGALAVSRGAETGTVAGAPDQGFDTQVYLGGHEPFIELEQLSPLFAPGTPARFVIELEAGPR